MKILIIILLLICPVAFAQDISVIDNSTISVSNPKKISDIESQIQIYKNEKQKWDDQYDSLIAPLQGQIDEAAQQGAIDAIPVASQDVRDNIRNKQPDIIVIPSNNPDTQGTVSIMGN